jgi:hypothetical protein
MNWMNDSFTLAAIMFTDRQTDGHCEYNNRYFKVKDTRHIYLFLDLLLTYTIDIFVRFCYF